MVDLAGYFAVGIGATGKGVDRLVAAGWVAREPNPDDGRSSLLRLTDEGTALVERAQVVLEELLARVTSSVDQEGLQQLAAVLGGSRTVLEANRIGVPAG